MKAPMSMPVYETTEKSRQAVLGGSQNLLIDPLIVPYQCRELIGVILRRELSVRFSASFFGRSWAVISPLVMLAIYLVSFNATFGRQIGGANFKAPDPLSVFAGLIIFNLFMEIIGRAPMLMHEHLQFIKRSLFPSVILGWIAVFRACVYGAIAGALLLVAELVLRFNLPWTLVILPFILAPMILFLVGLTLGMAAIGAFTRDLGHLVFAFAPLLMFVSPVFYSIDMVPEAARPYLYLNPMTPFIEMVRDVTIAGHPPSLIVFAATCLASILMFVGGNAIFSRYKDVLVDVI